MIFTGCYSVRKSVENSKPNSEKINWPANYKPREAKFFVHNEIDIKANPGVLWNILIEAEKWPGWYFGAENVNIINTNAGRLNDHSVFTWKTVGQNFTSTIKEFEKPYRLSWESEKKNIRGYHAWLMIPTDEGCKLITSESQHGFLTFMQKVFIPNKLRKLHDVWLTAIKNKYHENNK